MSDKSNTQEKKVTVDGVEVFYRTGGPSNGKLPLVMIHGTAGSIDAHFGFLYPMMELRQPVIAINLSEPKGDSIELEQFVAQVLAVIEAEAPNGPVSLLGYSLGSVVAAKTAALLGEKIADLILVCGWLKTDTHQKFRNHVWTSLQKQGSESVVEFMTFGAFSPFFMKNKTVEELRAGAARLKITPFIEKQMDLNARVDIEDDCPTIKSRTLIIGCSDDLMVPVHHSKSLFGAIDNASYTEIPSGHAVVHERPAELFYHVDCFLKYPGSYPVGEIIPAQKP